MKLDIEHADRWMERVIRAAAVAALVALGLMVWSFFSTQPLPLVVFMTVGQAIGTLSFAAFLFVVFVDLVRHRVIGPIRRRSSHPAPPEEDA